MALCRYETYLPVNGRKKRWGWIHEDVVYPVDDQAVALVMLGDSGGLGLLARSSGPDGISLAELDIQPGQLGRPSLVAPVLSNQEVWAAGVTYESSKFARMSESEAGGDFYARVYAAERPELFLKATPNRLVGPNGHIRIRADSKWNVPEPELAVLIAANGRVLGYT